MMAVRNWLLILLALVQATAGARVAIRLLRTARGTRIEHRSTPAPGEQVTVIVPVLDERRRLDPCLEGLMAQPAEVQEILVVDGGSRDGTQSLVRAAAERDARIRLLDAAPTPADWNGKAHGLQAGFLAAHPDSTWILTMDADVRPHPDLVRSLLHHVSPEVALQGVATRQVVKSAIDGLLHPALLTTLVYRHGIPGHNTSDFHEVQANGQCSLFRRAALDRLGGFALARNSRCEDVTMARALAASGHMVGFHEADDLVEAAMYDDWRETWRNWPRSLTLLDRYAGVDGWLRLAEATFAQGLPLPVLLFAGLPVPGRRAAERAPARRALRHMNLVLLVMRLGILLGTRRAYKQPPATYWLSPLADLLVTLRLCQSALQRTHTWRGRTLVPDDVWSVS
jgi:dolichol-phosphate mannosyltransferase